jgi:flagellar motor switch protein FliG
MAGDLTGLRKTAILMVSLDQDHAAEILKRLPRDAVEEIGREIASLGEIPVVARK